MNDSLMQYSRCYNNGNNPMKIVSEYQLLIKITTNLIRVEENLRDGLGENKAVPLLAELYVGKNNAKSSERCNMFSSCTIKAKCTPYDTKVCEYYDEGEVIR